MESLANEKMTLELKLANEKRDAVNEKENLSDELKSALEGKHKAQSMYEVSHAVAVSAVDSAGAVAVSSPKARI
jgi:hypothetical protein